MLISNNIYQRTKSPCPHQSLDYKTPDSVYASASGGGALIIDKFAERQKNADPKTVCMTPVVDQLDG